MNRCALLSFNCGETVLEGSWNQDIRVQHKQKRRENLGFKKKKFTLQNYKPKNVRKCENPKNSIF